MASDPPETLLNCALPRINSIDFPRGLNSGNKFKATAEAKASLSFALLRCTTAGREALYLSLPVTCPADSICLAHLTVPLQVAADCNHSALTVGHCEGL